MKYNNIQQYDIIPEDLRKYLNNFGRHFNRKLCDFAVSMMKKRRQGETIRLAPIEKEEVDKMLQTCGITLENNVLYDYVYIANMVKADMRGSSIDDDMHHAKAIRDFIDDIDQAEGYVFNRWMADICGLGIVVDWEDMI